MNPSETAPRRPANQFLLAPRAASAADIFCYLNLLAPNTNDKISCACAGVAQRGWL